MAMDRQRQKLVDHGAERLADALLILAQRHQAAADEVARLVSTPVENTERFRRGLAALRNTNHFYTRGRAHDFAEDLTSILADVKAGVADPRQGVELVLDFFEHDAACFEQADDSDGCIGDVFRWDARELFVEMATRVADKEWIAGRLFEVLADDGYGVRFCLLEEANRYLPPEVLRTLVERFQGRHGGSVQGEWDRYSASAAIKTLASQLADPDLYASAAQAASDGKLSAHTIVDVAEQYLAAGNAEKALSILGQVEENPGHLAGNVDELLMRAHQHLGNKVQVEAIARRVLFRNRTVAALDALVSIVGDGGREQAIDETVSLILADARWSATDAQFLLDTGRVDDAERYLDKHLKGIEGSFYGHLLPVAEGFEEHGRPRAASILYRELLESILNRGITKYYHHGVRYLRKLDELADKVTDWGNAPSHGQYFEWLGEKHGRKRSFWKKYEG